jgi:Domain of unknown function (DUF4214)
MLAERLAALLHSGCLGRPAAIPELSEAVAALDGGSEPYDLAFHLFQSPEFHSTSRFVALLYPALLQRAPDYITWKIYRNAIATGEVTREQMIERLLTSSEHAMKFRTRNDEDFIRMLYGALLVRRPEPHETLHYGINRAAVVESFLKRTDVMNGPTHRNTAFLLYSALLQRESAPSERDQRARQLQEGLSLRHLIADILNSPEFRALAGPDGDESPVAVSKPPFALRALHYFRSMYQKRESDRTER